MKRNIVATISLSSGKVSLTVLEKLSANSIVEIFNASGDIKTANSFLSSSIKEVENAVGGKLSTVGVVIEPSKLVDAKIELHRESIKISGDSVSQKDIDNVVELTKARYIAGPNRKVILVQPLKFDVHDLIVKSYLEAPIHKKGHTLIVSTAVTSISLEAYDYIVQVTNSLSLSISQILLSPQSISQNHLSESALTSGAILIHVSENHSFVTINKNRATLATLSIYDYGFKNLINAIVEVFSCTKKDARDIVAAHGSFKDTKRVTYTHQMGLKEQVFTSSDLNKIIRGFMTSLLVVIKKFLQQKDVLNLPIVISGKIWKLDHIEEFVKNFMMTELYVSVYNPMSFVETNDKNIASLGTIKFMNVMDKVMGRVYNTIIETNPGTLMTLKAQSQQNKGRFAKLVAKLGGNYDYS